jgi:hypothetical protein
MPVVQIPDFLKDTAGEWGVSYQIRLVYPFFDFSRQFLPVSPSPRLPVSPSPRLLENKGVIKTDLVSPLGRGEIQEKEDTNSRVIHIFWA